MADDGPKNDGEMLERLRELSIDTAAQQLRWLYEIKQSIPARSPGSLGPACSPCGPASALGGIPRPEPAKMPDASPFLFDLARLSLRNYEGWLKVTANHFDFLVDSLRSLTGQPERTPSRPEIELAIVTSVERPGTAQFVLENPERTEVKVTITPFELRREDGTGFRGELAIRADDCPSIAGQFILDPLACATLHLVAEPRDSTAGRYVGDAFVMMCDRVVGRLRVTVDVTS